MFPVDYQVNVHGDRGKTTYVLLENQGDRHLVVLPPALVRELTAYVRRGGAHDDGLVALIAEEALVIDRKRGDRVSDADARRVMAASRHPAIRRAALLRAPLAERPFGLTGEDLAWAFAIEVAKRRMPAA